MSELAVTRRRRPIRAHTPDLYFLDVTLNDFEITGPLLGENARRVSELVTEGQLHFTVEGANTVTVTFRDRMHEILDAMRIDVVDTNSPGDEHFVFMASMVLKNRVSGVLYEPTKVEKQDNDLIVTFEDQAVSKLRYSTGFGSPMKASRNRMTRAQFIHALAKSQHIEFVCPEENILQPAESPDQSSTDAEHQDRHREPGFNRAGAGLKVKGRQATRQQLKNLAAVLSVGLQKKMPKDVLLASIMASIAESTVNATASNSSDHVGLFQMSAGKGTREQRMDPEFAANWFYGEAFPLWRRNHTNPNGYTPAEIAYDTERPGPTQTPALYGQFESEAIKILRNYNGEKSGKTVKTVKVYQFKVEPNESYWDCIQRLATEVNWRAFVVDNVLYFMSEERLFKSRPQFTVAETLDWVDKIDFSLDASPKGETQLTVTAHAKKWFAKQGTVVDVDGLGPANGRWLVHEITRGFFDDATTIVLSKPLKKKKEPAPELQSVNVSTGLNNATFNKLYAAAVAIDKRNLPYVWDGGHRKLGIADDGFGGKTGDSKNIGFDCSGAVSALLGKIGAITEPLAIGQLISIGESGEGRWFTIFVANGPGLPGGGHTYVEFKTPNGGVQRWGAESSTGVGFKRPTEGPPREPYVKRRLPGL